jgi:hypothetical protein
MSETNDDPGKDHQPGGAKGHGQGGPTHDQPGGAQGKGQGGPEHHDRRKGSPDHPGKHEDEEPPVEGEPAPPAA